MAVTDMTSEVGYDAAEEFEGRYTPLQRLQSVLHGYPWLSPLIVLVLAMVLFSILSDGKTTTPANLGTVAQQTAVVGALAVGQTLVILTAGIDLSCAAIMVFSSMVMAKLSFDQGMPALPAIIIGVLIGGLAGAFNGFLITRVKLPPFIVTLGTLGIFTSLTLLYATGRTVQENELPGMHVWLGNAFSIGGFRLTTGVLVMIAMYAVFAYVLRYTAWGRQLYAVGDDPDAARLAGIKNNRMIISAYTVAGVIFGLAGWVIIGRIGAASPNVAADGNLDSITAVVIGGTSLFGGRGRIIGSLIGALIVGVVDNGLSVSGIDEAWKRLAIGALIIGAVTADQWIRKARA